VLGARPPPRGCKMWIVVGVIAVGKLHFRHRQPELVVDEPVELMDVSGHPPLAYKVWREAIRGMLATEPGKQMMGNAVTLMDVSGYPPGVKFHG
jgi:hypothetical protein